MNTDEEKEFLKELRTLLQKYHVSIHADSESDTQTVHGKRIEFYDCISHTVIQFQGWYLEYTDIEVEE